MTDRMIWVDVESFGLNATKDPLIEIGFKITDLDLYIIDEQDWVVWNDLSNARYEQMTYAAEHGNPNAKYVLEMHTNNGLFSDAKENGLSVEESEREMLKFLVDQNDVLRDEPLCGSSVQFDRAMLFEQFQTVHDLFSYRNIDISSVKELCKRYNPQVYAKLDETIIPQKKHRVMDDLDDTVAEFKYYLENFLWVTDG